MIISICCVDVDTTIIRDTRLKWYIYVGYVITMYIVCLVKSKQIALTTRNCNNLPMFMFLTLLIYFFLRGGSCEGLIAIGASVLLTFNFERLRLKYVTVCVGLIFAGIISVIYILFLFIIKGCFDVPAREITPLTLTMTLSMLSIVCLSRIGSIKWIKQFSYIYIVINILIFYCILARTALFASVVVLLYSLSNYRIRMVMSLVVIGLIVLISKSNLKKVESTMGRQYIIQTSMSLLEQPNDYVVGIGGGAFKKEYMKAQASSLELLPFEYKFRAGNIRHPLNEFILWMIEYGLFMIGIIVFLIFLAITSNNIFCKLSMLIIVVFMCFSYPMKYPITWLVFSFAVSERKFFKQDNDSILKSKCMFEGFFLFIVFIITSSLSIKEIIGCHNWSKAISYTQVGKFEDASRCYEKASLFLSSPQFLYNMAYFENLSGNYQKALYLIDKNGIYDYEVAMLKSNVYINMRDFPSAITELNMAQRMCPNRFVPLFEKYKIYEELQDSISLGKLRFDIVNKSVKIPSRQVDMIKEYVKK